MGVDLKSIAAELVTDLPLNARWIISGTPLDFNFSVARQGLHALPDEILETSNADGSELLIFGDQDFADGGGAQPWLCVCQRDGSVCGFDPERRNPIFSMNSSIKRFVATFRLLDKYLAKGDSLPSDYESLLEQIDPLAYPTSDWRLLAEHLRTE